MAKASKKGKGRKGASARPEVAEMRQRFLQLYAAPLCDVLDRMDMPNQVLDLAIKPFLPDMKIAGPAYTLKSERAHPEETRGAKVDLVGGMTPGCVAVYSVGSEDRSGHWGELTSNAAAAKGCCGAVVDGNIRDSTQHVQIPGWSCFSRGTSPIEFGSRGRITVLQEPILMSGSLTTVVPVQPGDWVFGDSDGVVILPQEIALDVLKQAEEQVAKERKSRALLRKGEDLRTVKEKYRVG